MQFPRKKDPHRMGPLSQLLYRLLSFFYRARLDRELDAEMSSHLQFAMEENLRRGLAPEEARRQALVRFGGPQQAKEQHREARGLPFLDMFLQDLRFAFRMLRKCPGFTAVAVLTLALGIGANAAIFSVVYAVLLKSLPYPQADRLVMVYEDVRLPNYQNDRNEVSPGNFSDWTKQNTVFENVAAYRNRSFNLAETGEPLRVEGELVTANFFTTLQIDPELGRGFVEQEDHPGASHVVLMADSLWKSRFASDPQILGKKILLDGESYEVVGIAPPGFHFPDFDDQLWVPIALSPAARLGASSRNRHSSGARSKSLQAPPSIADRKHSLGAWWLRVRSAPGALGSERTQVACRRAASAHGRVQPQPFRTSFHFCDCDSCRSGF